MPHNLLPKSGTVVRSGETTQDHSHFVVGRIGDSAGDGTSEDRFLEGVLGGRPWFVRWIGFGSFCGRRPVVVLVVVFVGAVEKRGERYFPIDTGMIVDTDIDEVGGAGVGMEFGVG